MKKSNPHQHNLELLRRITPEMRYSGEVPFEQWQKTTREKLAELLGLHLFTRCEPCLDIEYDIVTNKTREIRFTFQSEQGYFVPCHLLIPKSAKAPLPVAICLQGHSTGMHLSLGRPKYYRDEKTVNDGRRATALWAIRSGYCALVTEQRNFGECGGTEAGPDCYNSSMTALLTGRSTVGERVWDVQRVIDILEKYFPQVDNRCIICVGGSGGGTTAFYTACIDERIKVTMPCRSVCEYEDSIAPVQHCSCNYVPSIRRYFEMGDLGGLIAPRKLLVVTGENDPFFPIDGVKRSFDAIKGLYDKAGCGENCELVIGKGGHEPFPDLEWSALKKLIEIGRNSCE